MWIAEGGLFPPALLLLQIALERRSLLIGAAFAVVAAALALGRNQVALLLCFVLAAAVLGEIAIAARPLRYLRERAAVLLRYPRPHAVGEVVGLPALVTAASTVRSVSESEIAGEFERNSTRIAISTPPIVKLATARSRAVTGWGRVRRRRW